MKNTISTTVLAIILSLSNFCLGWLAVSSSQVFEKVRYCGGDNFVTTYEELKYAKKETTSQYSMKGDVPNYSGYVDASNCANVAGAEVIGYYDRFCENLVPNYKTYIQIGSMLVYRAASEEISQVMSKLKNYMGTDAGTTFNGFHKGMKTYVEEHSYSYQTEDLGSLNFNNYKAAVEANKPVALFLSNYSFFVNSESISGGERLQSEFSNVAHVVIGCGYKIDTYYNSSNQIIYTRTYLKVASGFDLQGVTYLCLDGKSTIDRATSIVIS